MAKNQEINLMAGDIADDWVDIGDDDQYSDHTKPKINAQDDDHVKAKVDQNKAADQNNNEKSSSDDDDKGKILKRDIQVAQNMAKVFDCKDNIIELEIVSGAKVQFTKKRCDQGSNNNYIVRLIGYLKSVEKAEKLIKAVVSLVEAGGIELLQFKDKKSDSAAVSTPGFKFSQPPAAAAAAQAPRTMQPARPCNLYNITEYPFPEAFHPYVSVSLPPPPASFGPFGVSSSAGHTTPVLSPPVSFIQSAGRSFSRTLVTEPPPQGKSQGPFNQSGGSVSRPFAPHRSGKKAAAAASKSHH